MHEDSGSEDERRSIVKSARGLTLVELLLAVTVLSLMALAFFSITHTTLRSWAHAGDRDEVTERGRAALERITQRVREAHRVLLPFQFAPLDTSTHRILCVALGVDNDGDGRVDEDSYDVYQDGTASGLPGLDDDWDGSIDEGSPWNDDESGDYDEDALDGVSNDGDSWIDEDWGADMNGDGAPGVAYIDDDNDGWVDEGSVNDDDEDGWSDEDPIEPLVYYVDPAERPPVLAEFHPLDGTTVLVTNLYYESEEDYADGFRVTRVNLVNGTTVLHISLRLMTEAGELAEFRTTVACRNDDRTPRWQSGGGPVPP